MMFKIESTSLDISRYRQSLDDVRAGALATFEGRVRNHNDGRQVVSLEYEAYEALAIKEGDKIIQEAKERFAIYDCICVHRVGMLELSDMAVWVGVIAAHRDAAFAACQYIIDEVKHRVPIWKRETYVDGNTTWVNCAHQGKPRETTQSRTCPTESVMHESTC